MPALSFLNVFLLRSNKTYKFKPYISIMLSLLFLRKDVPFVPSTQ